MRAGFEARVVDENDLEAPHGTVGELMVRANKPWTMNHGYNANPEATARAWRNGWFHTATRSAAIRPEISSSLTA